MTRHLVAVLVPVVWLGAALAAQSGAGSGQVSRKVLDASAQDIEVRSTAFADGDRIPEMYSDYGQKVSPALTWRGGPAETASYAVMMEDPDADEPTPYVHWLVYDIPATTLHIDEARPGTPKLLSAGSALQGRTSRGNIGYFGPRPPVGDAPHHYHVQVFALDRRLDLQPGADRATLLEAMRGHVLASGSLVGTFTAPEDARQPAPGQPIGRPPA